MHWGSEHVDEDVKRVLLDSSWLDVDDQDRTDRLAHHLDHYPGDPADLVERVRHHEIFGLFTRTLVAMTTAGGHENVASRFQLAALQDEWAQNRKWLDLYYAELADILAASREVGIRPVVLKGAAWEIDFYQKTRTRSFGDLDLYVNTPEMESFGAVLRTLGYEQSIYDPGLGELVQVSPERNRAALESGRHATPFVKRAGFQNRHLIVEPHGPRNDENLHKIDSSVFFARSRELALDGLPGRQLSVVDSLIYASAHIRKNLYVYPPVGRVAFPQLRWYTDIRQMFLAFPDGETWRDLYAWAAELHRVDAVYQAVTYTDMLFPGVVPSELLVPPDRLSRPPVAVVDDVWRFRTGSSRFEQRLFEPHVDEARYLRLRDTGHAGKRLSIPRVDDHVDTGARPDDWPWGKADAELLSGVTTPDWQFFRTHVSYGAVPEDDAEFSASFQVLATEAALAFRVQVKDRQLFFGQNRGYYHGQDCVQLLFESPLGSRGISNVLLVPSAADLPGPAALFHYSGNDKADTEQVPDSQIEADISADGYTVTTVIPLSALRVSAGKPFGFDACVYESGRPGEERRSVLQWSGGRNNLRNPSFFATAEIASG